MSTPVQEFNVCVLGLTSVGKTSILQRLNGVHFERKHHTHATMEDEPTKYSFEVPTSAGLVLLNFYDWDWEEKRKNENIHHDFNYGNDGAVFVFDVTNHESLRSFAEFSGWYESAVGLNKPYLLVSNKNDQHKKSVHDHDINALVHKVEHRAYVAVNLIDDTGLNELIHAAAKLMTKDPSLSVTGPYTPASEASKQWSTERAAATKAHLGLGVPAEKTKRAVLVVLENQAVV